MRYSVFAFILFLSVYGCKKSSLNRDSQNNPSINNNDTASITKGYGWSFQMNGDEAVYGTTNECIMAYPVGDSPPQLVMDGQDTLGIYSLGIQMNMPSYVPVVGQYVAVPQGDIATGTGSYNIFGINYLNPQGLYTFYTSDSMTLNVVSYDSSTGTVSVTFYGKVADPFGNISTITNGSITGIIQQ